MLGLGALGNQLVFDKFDAKAKCDLKIPTDFKNFRQLTIARLGAPVLLWSSPRSGLFVQLNQVLVVVRKRPCLCFKGPEKVLPKIYLPKIWAKFG